MAKSIYTVTEVKGSKRSSDAVYTHALIGQYDPTIVAARWESDHKTNAVRNTRWETKHYNDEKRCANAAAGEFYVNHNGYRVQQSQSFRDISLEFMAKYPTLESYLEAMQARYQKTLADIKAEKVGPVQVLQWSRSAVNAAKGISKFQGSYRGLKVVPVIKVK